MAAASVRYFATSDEAADAAAALVQGRRSRAGEGIARREDGSRGGSAEGGARLMLYHLLYPFHTQLSVLNVTRYITFRTAAARLSALAISLALGPWLIRKLREFQIGQVIRAEGPQTHRPKAGTPTMGGLLILTAALVPTLLWADLTNVYVWIAVLTTAGFGAIGFADDYLKIVRRSHHGLLPRYKMGFQILIGVAVGVVLLILQRKGLYNTRLVFPFFKRLIPDLGWRLPAVRGVRARRRVERRQPDRRPRRSGDQHVRDRRRRVHRARLRHRPPRVRRLPAAGALSAGGGADGLLRLAGRRVARLPLVQLVPRRNLHGRRRIAGARRRARHRRDSDQAGTAAA